MKKMVLFDLDDTILWDKKSVQDAFDLTCRLAEKEAGTNPVELEKNVRTRARELYASYPTYAYTQKIGINPFEGLWATFEDPGEEFRKLREIAPVYQEKAWLEGLKDTGADLPELAKKLAEAFRSYRIESPHLFEDALSVLTELGKDYRLALVTNGSPSLQNLKLEISPELPPYFEKIFISGDIGTGKPDPEIFHHVLQHLAIDPEEAVMVGDNLNTDIIGANRTGIDSVWLNRFDAENRTDIEPAYEIKSLTELKNILQP
ncbi:MULTISPECIES: HAD family hydrolase [Oceanobacillus]|uniref:HAD family hydrolase n=1 Tax=Oceanobacillus TaxID=182709 RepID=UPI002115F5A8|nr:HAD family hydrolase [Oceanobacillus oncorhynchi]UUI39267.1 HAD family hydrolase [Oceanobacillus oncorhynchi]